MRLWVAGIRGLLDRLAAGDCEVLCTFVKVDVFERKISGLIVRKVDSFKF